MLERVRGRPISPAALVVVPIIVLTTILAGMLSAVIAQNARASGHPLGVLVSGACAYALAVAVLLRFGLAGVDRLQRLGLTDSLAAMPNRRALHLDFARHPAADEMALALLDLDGFKSVKDHTGISLAIA